jgi:FixJ family two-component response regulator
MGTGATVHLVDDDPSFLTAVGRFLRTAGFTVSAFSSGTELLAQVSPDTRGCIVVDLEMPGLGGLEVQALLACRGVALPLVFLTGHGTVPSSVHAMRGGAVDFLEKLAPKEQLTEAIRRALERDAQMQVARLRLAEVRHKLAALTDRERDVLTLVARGKMNKQIAGSLGIHERTVKLHRTAITTKLGMHAAAQLALFASEARLLEF